MHAHIQLFIYILLMTPKNNDGIAENCANRNSIYCHSVRVATTYGCVRYECSNITRSELKNIVLS